MTDIFTLHPQLAADTIPVSDWALSRVLLMNDARFPWIILVPRRPRLTELHDLTHPESQVLSDEMRRAAKGLKKITECAKLNIASLGNVVPQLHIHIVARDPGDAAWPGPVWGKGEPVRYQSLTREDMVSRLRAGL